jgi:DNA-binding NarL/FixJ family response regulator
LFGAAGKTVPSAFVPDQVLSAGTGTSRLTHGSRKCSVQHKVGGQGMVNSSGVVRILVVDDYERFRAVVRSLLEASSKLHIVDEAHDGLQAVQKAEELQPDLILLDIGLPKLNGIQAALQIQQVSRKSKILFLSENRSWDIAEECLRIGARGYVTKSSAARELLPAIEEVLRGNQFVTASLTGRDFSVPRPEHVPNAEDCKDSLAPLAPANIRIRHEVEFYSDDVALVNGFARVMQAALIVGNAVVLIATEPHREGILQKMRQDGVDVDAVLEQGRCIPLDAGETLSEIMVAGLPDPGRCATLVGGLLTEAAKRAKRGHPRVAICGECAPTLLAEGNPEAAVLLEHFWDEITGGHDADTLCGYLWSAVPHQGNRLIFERICAEHSAVHGRALGY